MTASEDRLRDLLHREAATLVPAGDGLAKIQQRVIRRRRGRWLVPAAALAASGAAAVVLVLAPAGDRTASLTPGSDPARTPGSTSQQSASPTTSPMTSRAAGGRAAVAVPDDGGQPLPPRTGIWPFATQQQAARWRTDQPWADQGLEVGRRFVQQHLHLSGVQVVQSCVSCDVLGLQVGGRQVGELSLYRFGTGFASGHGAQVYTVSGVVARDLTVTAPRRAASVVSPLHVTGRVPGVDENVLLQLVDRAGRLVAQTSAPAGSAQPWRGDLTWKRADWSSAALVAVTRSAKDGSVTRVAVVLVARAGS